MTITTLSTRRSRALLELAVALALLAIARCELAAQNPTAKVDVPTAAAASRELRVIIKLGKRRLFVVRDSADTLLSAPVAVGSGRSLSSAGRLWRFATPRGIRKVISVEVEPVWIRPDWSYVEAARANHLRLDSVTARRPRPLPNGDTLIVRGTQVGVLRDSVFSALPVGEEVVFGSTLYMPPIGTEPRSVPKVLGAYRLNLGNGIGIHGTTDTKSIGRAVTHGCLRLGDSDLEWVFKNVGIGTPVFIDW